LTDTRTLFDAIVKTAEAVLPLIVPGSAPAIAAGTKIVDLINEAMETFPDDNHDKLDAAREDIEERINAHVDSTVDKLRGGS
jgi:hypothetical protein